MTSAGEPTNERGASDVEPANDQPRGEAIHGERSTSNTLFCQPAHGSAENRAAGHQYRWRYAIEVQNPRARPALLHLDSVACTGRICGMVA